MHESSGRSDEYVGMPILVMGDNHTGCICAAMVPDKGRYRIYHTCRHTSRGEATRH